MLSSLSGDSEPTRLSGDGPSGTSGPSRRHSNFSTSTTANQAATPQPSCDRNAWTVGNNEAKEGS